MLLLFPPPSSSRGCAAFARVNIPPSPPFSPLLPPPPSLSSPHQGQPPNWVRAAAHYRAASDARNAQASWNLGFMYQLGHGLPYDPHLAKRFYDNAMHTDTDASVPSKLALAALWANTTLCEALDDPSGFLAERGRQGDVFVWEWVGRKRLQRRKGRSATGGASGASGGGDNPLRSDDGLFDDDGSWRAQCQRLVSGGLGVLFRGEVLYSLGLGSSPTATAAVDSGGGGGGKSTASPSSSSSSSSAKGDEAGAEDFEDLLLLALLLGLLLVVLTTLRRRRRRRQALLLQQQQEQHEHQD